MRSGSFISENKVRCGAKVYDVSTPAEATEAYLAIVERNEQIEHSGKEDANDSFTYSRILIKLRERGANV